jgi:ADP-ribose pyrophosphatase
MTSDWLSVEGANPWQTRSSAVVYDNGRLRLLEDAVIQPDGQPGQYTYIEVPWPVVAVVPVSDDLQVYLVRQWRYVWGRNSWEIPAGHGEPGEEPLASAQRELAEEVGLHASDWASLGEGFSSATIRARYHLYLARGLSPAPNGLAREGAEHDMLTLRLPLDAAVAAALDGRIVHAFSVVGLLRAARRLGVDALTPVRPGALQSPRLPAGGLQ